MTSIKVLEQFKEPVEIINKIKKLDSRKIAHIATVVDTLYMVQMTEGIEEKTLK